MKRRIDYPKSIEGAEQCVRDVWGFDGLRPAQRSLLSGYVAGRDVLGVLPTGGGKSLLYQVPALLGTGVVVVVSPLIALMEDQVAGLTRRGVPAVALTSGLGPRAIEQAMIDARYGKYRLLFLAPERLQSDVFRYGAEHLDVSLLAVDEAHCVSEWAPHFRPAYREISAARALLGDPPMMAVTATATPEVRADVVQWLGLRDPLVQVHGFDRPNLHLTIRREDNKRARVRALLGHVEGCGIIYASTRREVERWCDWLSGQGVDAVAYHGGMDLKARTTASARWMHGKARVMVATNAFGMGVDKPDVRFVVHVELPASLEAYYQEAGRAGRDGLPAHAVLLWQPRDLETQQRLLDASHPTRPQLAQVFDALGNLAQIPIGSVPEAPVRVYPDRVASLTGIARSAVDNALSVLERAGALSLLPTYGDGWFRWQVTRDVLRATTFTPAVAGFLETLLRVLPREAFHDPVEVRLKELGRAVRLAPPRLERGLNYLQERAVARWEPADTAHRVVLQVPRSRNLSVDDRWLEHARAASEKRLAYLSDFLQTSVCRRRFLLGYFGEDAPDRCGRCDVCRSQSPADDANKTAIAGLLSQIDASDLVVSTLSASHRRLVGWLLREGYVACADELKQQYALTPSGRSYLRTLSASADSTDTSRT